MRTRHPLIIALVAGTLSTAACGPADPGSSGAGAAGSGGSQSTGGTGQAGGVNGGTGGNGVGGAHGGNSGGSSAAGVSGASGLGGATGGAGATAGGGGTAGAAGAGARGGRGGDAAGGATGGVVGAAGAGGTSTGGRGGASGGSVGSGGSTGGRGGASGAGTAGASGTGGSGTGRGGSGGAGTCTASKSVNTNATGSGPHKVVVETNAESGISEGTIFRPMDLGGTEKYPIFVWGEGGCSQNGLSNSAAMAEIASHGYFVVADGTPNSTAPNRAQTSDAPGMAKPLLAYITWAIAQNDKPCSAYYQSLDPTKVASNGFSCGGLMSEGTAADSRMTTWGINSSGLTSANQAFYKTVRTPVLIVLGGPSDIAYQNGERDYDSISALGIPVMLFSKDLGHGGDLFSTRGGDFTKIDLAWLNWRLKGDETATGKGLLVGSGCSYCTNSAWEVKSKNIQ